MKQVQKWAQTAGIAVALATGEAGWTFEPPQPPPPPPPERVIISQHGSGSFLGIGVQEIDADRAKALNLREERGVEVTRVEDDSPAAKGGIKTGDVVLEYNGDRVEGVEQFMRMVRETPPGREVKLSIARNGSPQQLTMKTGSRKTWMTTRYGDAVDIPRIEIPEINMPDVPRAFMSWRSSVVGNRGRIARLATGRVLRCKRRRSGSFRRSRFRCREVRTAGRRRHRQSRRHSRHQPSRDLRDHSVEPLQENVPVQVIRDKRELTLQLPVEDSASDTYHAMPKRK